MNERDHKSRVRRIEGRKEGRGFNEYPADLARERESPEGAGQSSPERQMVSVIIVDSTA